MEIYGLIGKKLEHSFSSTYFRRKFQELNYKADYLNFELDCIDHFPQLIRQHSSIKGLNVTVPYKESIIPFIDELDPVSKKIGAVNTINVIRNAKELKLVGYNTDALGFEKALSPLIANKPKPSALILGTGGSSKAIQFVLRRIGIQYKLVSRSFNKSGLTYSSLDEEIINSHLLIINTTPLGMFPEVDSYPEIPYQFLTPAHLLFDLIYYPAETAFLKKGIEKRAMVANGLNMLRFQAEASWKIWQDAK